MRNVLLLLMMLIAAEKIIAQEKKEPPGRGIPPVFKNEVPDQPFDILLSYPKPNNICFNIRTSKDSKGKIVYQLKSTHREKETATAFIKANVSEPITIENLPDNAIFQYQFFYQPEGQNEMLKSELSEFHTQKSADQPFVFAIQADSHLDENTDTSTYLKTLDNINRSGADFLVDLGDTWMTDKYRPDYTVSEKQYRAQRYYFGSVCHSMPLFLTLGNHDGESGKEKEKQLLEWAYQTRMKFYNNPEKPNSVSKDFKNYYSWEWGNALFVVLDPFRYTIDNKDPWQRTLGAEQYQWLEKTLGESRAQFKFIFIHNLVGGVDRKGIARGGVEASVFYEWGGLNSDSTLGFKEHRPNWPMPIHELLVKNKVTAVFHGHDHFYAQQEKDGIIYQLVPQPGAMRYDNINQAEEYGYRSGQILNAPAFLKISVFNTEAKVELIQTSIRNSEKNNVVLHSYLLRP